MNTVELLEQPSYKSFLLSSEPLRNLRATLEKRGQPGARGKELLQLARAVVDSDIDLSDIPDLIAEAFECSLEVAKEIARDVVGYRLLPLKDVVPGVEEALKALGGEAANYPTLASYREPRSALAWARELVAEFQLPFTDVLLKRLALLLEQRSLEQKTAADLITFFGRPLSIGGLALEKSIIEPLSAKIEEEAQRYRLVSEEAWAKIEADNAPIADDDPWADAEPTSETSPLSVSASTELEIAPSHELAATVPVINAPKKVEEIVEPSADDALRARSAKRSSEQAAVLLARATELMMNDVAAIFSSHAGLDRRAVMDAMVQALRGAKEEKHLEVTLREKFAFAPEDIDAALLALSKAKDVFATAGESPANASDESVDLVEAMETEILDGRFKAITGTAPKPTHSSPSPLKVELTVGSVPAKSSGKLTDIAPGRRLMGPVEQLGSMTLQDFRRLAASPDVAVQKIEGLLSSLEATSVEERGRGVKALRESPLMRMYAGIARDALMKRMSVAEAAAARKQIDGESLGPQDVKAILGLHTKLAA